MSFAVGPKVVETIAAAGHHMDEHVARAPADRPRRPRADGARDATRGMRSPTPSSRQRPGTSTRCLPSRPSDRVPRADGRPARTQHLPRDRSRPFRGRLLRQQLQHEPARRQARVHPEVRLVPHAGPRGDQGDGRPQPRPGVPSERRGELRARRDRRGRARPDQGPGHVPEGARRHRDAGQPRERRRVEQHRRLRGRGRRQTGQGHRAARQRGAARREPKPAVAVGGVLKLTADPNGQLAYTTTRRPPRPAT